METKDQRIQDLGRGIKAYHKPGVQIYGTLSQLTGAQPGLAGHANDGSFQAPATPQNRRT